MQTENNKEPTLTEEVIKSHIDTIHNINPPKKTRDGKAITSFELRDLQEKFERPLILKTLQQLDFNQSRAALYLGINRATLRSRMTRYDIPGMDLKKEDTYE